MIDHNRKRALAEVVTLDAWHDGFTEKRKAVDLHVDVVFTPGRIGGGPGEDVRFKLCLKRAEIVVVIPPTEPARVDKASVSRDAPKLAVKTVEVRKSKDGLAGSGGIDIKGNTRGINASGSLSAKASKDRVREKAVRISENLQSMQVTQIQTPDGDYAWLVEPTSTDSLKGRPWNGKKEPRLKIQDKRLDRNKGLEPAIRVEVRCRREDLEITDIALKDKSEWLSKSPFKRNKMVAAEALIRTKLFEAGLLEGDLNDPYAQMTLCATIAENN